MKYFIFAMFFIFSAFALHAQDFFIPANALSSSVDKIKPLNSNVEKSLSNYNQRRYKVIDGLVIPLPNEPSLDEAPETPVIESENIDTQSQKSDKPADQTMPSEISETAEIISTNNNLPTNDSPHFQQETLSEEQFIENDNNPQADILLLQPPATQDFNSKLPLYKNRYTLYLNDLKTFQKTKKFPKNKELDDLLQKLSRPRELTLFEGEIK